MKTMKQVFAFALFYTFIGIFSLHAQKFRLQAEELTEPFPISFSSEWVMDNPVNAVTVLNIYKDYENNIVLSPHLLDSTVQAILPDGRTLTGKGAVIELFENSRASVLEVRIAICSITSVHAKRTNEDLVQVSGKQWFTDEKGTPVMTMFNSSWTFTPDGKVKLIRIVEDKPSIARN
jgi:hypothetical protein